MIFDSFYIFIYISSLVFIVPANIVAVPDVVDPANVNHSPDCKVISASSDAKSCSILPVSANIPDHTICLLLVIVTLVADVSHIEHDIVS